jgi:lysozyme
LIPYTVKLSPRGTLFIARFEGFRAFPYNDAATPPNATIGYGHLLHYGPVTEADIKRGDITESAALKLLAKDAGNAIHAVKTYIHVRLNQSQKDALISFVYNCGVNSLNGSNVQRCVNARNFAAVPSALDQWVHAGGKVLEGLVNRRHAEGALFLHGTYKV